MHQNLAVILQQLCYGKISFAVMVPEVSREFFRARPMPERLGKEFDPGSGAAVAVIPVEQLKVGRQEGEAVVRT